jgi:hypothetical protein
MPKVYRKIVTGQHDDGERWSHSTNMFTCENCLDQNNLPKIDWVSTYVEDIVPGDGNPGVYVEAPFETCDRCFAVDEESRDEYENWSADMDRQHWEEQEYPQDYTPQENK